METIYRVDGVEMTIGGERHTGWLPEGAAEPSPTPVEKSSVDVYIVRDGTGYLLIHECHEAGKHVPPYSGDSWFATLQGAVQAAQRWFGVEF